MPWFFEAMPLIEDAAFMSNIDPRRMFVCLEQMSKPQRGLRGLRMNIANRRRVWGVCAQLAARYNEKLPRSHNQGRETLAKGEEEEEAQSIMANATNPHMPRIREDPRHSVFKGSNKKNLVDTVVTQWICAWGEIGAPGTAVETAWDECDCFTGIAVEIRGERRRFGSGWEGNVCRRELPAGVWIDGLILHIQYPSARFRLNRHQNPREGYDHVMGVEVRFRNMVVMLSTTLIHQVSCNDGSRIAMGSCAPEHVKRPLIVGDQMALVGLMGKVVVCRVKMQPSKIHTNGKKNGMITRMGLLEHRRPGAVFNHRQQDPKPHLAREILWENDAHEQLGGRRIWDLQSLHLSIPQEEGLHDPFIDSIASCKAFFWGTSEEELQRLCCLSGLVAIRRSKPDNERRSFRGVDAQYTRPGPESRRIELTGKKDEDLDTVHFEIDGAGGERVTRVEVGSITGLKVGRHA